MAQVKNVPDFALESLNSRTKKECRLCGRKENLNLCWNGDTVEAPLKNFYICKECYHVIRGLYIDTLLEIEENKGISVNNQLRELEERISNLKNIRTANKSNMTI